MCNLQHAEVLSVPAQPLPAAAGPGRRSKKGKRKGLQQQPDDSLYVNVVPLSSIDDALDKVRGLMRVPSLLCTPQRPPALSCPGSNVRAAM